jgi:hypothetical protein
MSDDGKFVYVGTTECVPSYRVPDFRVRSIASCKHDLGSASG